MKHGLVLFVLILAACSASHAPSSLPAGTANGVANAAVAANESNTRSAAAAELKTYYFEAARSGDITLINEYVSSGFPVDVRTPQGYTALILAAYHGQKVTVERLLALGADACARDSHGSTALMGATFKGELAIARLLLSQPCAKVDDRNSSGQTAAMYAGLAGNRALVEMLRQRGANLSLQDQAGHSAASLARGQGADDVATWIEHHR
ncbi:ankyrin repeat domain-containing protein [Dyella silvatica]|uniref:ankyrin repeat domain-containing protein n=1 Tax=Dyella silvatica TaxID=2992128 RepID=UPI002259AFE5|nr:ankyrin repeat domain-containing protein [Dyella silvatica]